MNVFILCIVCTGLIFLICYAGWWWGQRKKVDPKVAAMLKRKQTKLDIVKAIYDEAKSKKDLPRGSAMLKIAILVKLNISPEVMRQCLNELEDEMRIIESDDSVALTSFGVQHHEVFGG